MSFEYQIGGSLRAGSPSYVYRQADHVFYNALRNGTFCYVLNSRQMGKSSLRVQVMKRLQVDGFECIFIDLTGMGRQGLTREKWYAGFIQALVAGSSLSSFSWRAWWREQRALLTPCQCLGVFLEEILSPGIDKPLIIFVDEIDRVLSQSFSLDEFFGLIRSFSEKRVSSPPAITFALLGVASPTDLIRDNAKSPFNIGQAIALSGFTRQEAHPLLAGLDPLIPNAAFLLQDILEWTNGQPFLTQKLCQLVVEELENDPGRTVDSVVQSRILEHWESQDEPEHLRTIRDRILRHRQMTIPCLELYAQVLSQGSVKATRNDIQQSLKLSGVVIERAGYLYPHNRIYQELFDQTWVQEQLDNIRPYAETLEFWMISGQPTDQHLLTGEPLSAALKWSKDRQLSEKDYQFLSVSQQQETQSAQQSRDMTEQAHQLLQTAQVQARHQAAQYQFPWSRLGIVAVGVTAAVLGVSRLGWIQRLELSLYDWGVRLKPPLAKDERIVLVTIDEDDIQQLGQWPLPDQTLAKTLQILQDSGAHSVGLDIYRDLPIEPGHQSLTQQFAQSSNIFGIKKLIGQSIPGPPSLDRRNTGFADQVLDDDGRLRRALLSMEVEGDLSFSFATQLALDFLRSKNIEMVELEEDGSQVQLGQAVFHRLEAGQGAYQRIDTGGYQTLLNWSGASFERLSLQQVLNRESPTGGWRDRIVLIGVTSEGTKDFFYTPFSYQPFQSPEQMAGVAIHAQIVSLLVGAALGERSLLHPAAQPIIYIWTLGSSLVGAVIAGRLNSKGLQIFSSGVVLVILGGSFLLVLWGGTWLTLTSSLIAFSGAQLGVLGLKNQQQKQYRQRLLAQLLQRDSQTYPIAGSLATELWRRSR